MLKCPTCPTAAPMRVIDSRQSPKTIRRRRECTTCKRRWTSIEYIPQEATVPGPMPRTAQLKGVAAEFDIRVRVRFVDGELVLHAPRQSPERSVLLDEEVLDLDDDSASGSPAQRVGGAGT